MRQLFTLIQESTHRLRYVSTGRPSCFQAIISSRAGSFSTLRTLASAQLAFGMATAMSTQTVPNQEKHRLNLLSLDGGGIKGISSLVILHHIMEGLNMKRKEAGLDELLPIDVFDLAGGTSAGGLIALMLFRVGMSTEKAISKFEEISMNVFPPRLGPFNLHDMGIFGYWVGNGYLKFRALVTPSRFSSKYLKQSIADILKEEPNASLYKDSKSGRMFVCATRIDRGEAVLFRSYKPPADARSTDFENVSISDAACATSAAPTFLPSVNIDGVDFWDGGLLNNNPVNQVWDSRYDLAESLPIDKTQAATEPDVGTLISIGTGRIPSKTTMPAGLLETAAAALSYSTNTIAKDKDFARSLYRFNQRKPEAQRTKYFRFDAPMKDVINIDDYKKMKTVKVATEDWLKDGGRELLESCIQELAKNVHKRKSISNADRSDL